MKRPPPSAASSPSVPDRESRDQGPSTIRRLARNWRLVLVVSTAVVVVGWCILWVFAAWTTVADLEDWAAQEHLVGRNWSCADRRFGGFPFHIELTCDKPSFQGGVGDTVVVGTLGGLAAAAPVYAPRTIALAVDGPLDVESSDGRSLHIAWASLAVNLGFDADGLGRARLAADGLQLLAKSPQFADFSFDAHRAETDFAVDPGRPADAAAYDFSFRIDEGKLQALDRLFNDVAPATMQAAGVISHLTAAGDGGDLAEAAEMWRRAGGAIDLTEALLRKGTAEVGASGHLDLDALHRLQGRVDASGDGLEPILARYGIPSGALAIDGLLAGILGSQQRASGRAPPALRFPLRLENGRVFIGPVRTPLVLPPLY